MPKETEIYAQLIDKTRELTNYYFKQLEPVDWHKTFEIDGIKLNTVYWLAAHLPVTQNWLLLKCTGGPSVKVPFSRQFGMGAIPPAVEDCPPKEEILKYYHEVHRTAVDHIRSLDDSVLDQDNPTGFELLGEKSIRFMIVHAIRHENNHAGHLGWLCKLNGIKTL